MQTNALLHPQGLSTVLLPMKSRVRSCYYVALAGIFGWSRWAKACNMELGPLGLVAGDLHLPTITGVHTGVHIQPMRPLFICDIILKLPFIGLEVGKGGFHLAL